jgi:hypothetical protein
VKTWGDVEGRQDFNIAWYVNKPPTFAQKPELITLDVDYDNIRDGTDKAVFVYNSPPAIDVERDTIKMSFVGIELIPCKCVKIAQRENGYKLVVYKEAITAADQRTFNITIFMKDD